MGPVILSSAGFAIVLAALIPYFSRKDPDPLAQMCPHRKGRECCGYRFVE